jgi:glycosyltransferase involved in cell wall biosynthesis
MNFYDIIYITNLPSFYKLNLLNRIAEKRKILVIFTHETSNQRNSDFYIGDRNFEFISVANLFIISKVFKIYKTVIFTKHSQLIIGGWDQILFWFLAIFNKKEKNSVIVESSIHESQVNGIKGLLKTLFLSRISRAYVSGKSNADLVECLNFKGKVVITRGVGIFRIVQQPSFTPSTKVTNFLYVGRLSSEKNLVHLIEVFNDFPKLNLNIVGYGPLENHLKSISGMNIRFYGAIPNIELSKVYNDNDVLILPSLAEPWGLVVEEALNNGLPVIVSNRVGCAEEIVNESNGIIFDVNKLEDLKIAIQNMIDISYYNSLKRNISNLDFDNTAKQQVNCYINSL